jgi:hypothetical protein
MINNVLNLFLYSSFFISLYETINKVDIYLYIRLIFNLHNKFKESKNVVGKKYITNISSSISFRGK